MAFRSLRVSFRICFTRYERLSWFHLSINWNNRGKTSWQISSIKTGSSHYSRLRSSQQICGMIFFAVKVLHINFGNFSSGFALDWDDQKWNYMMHTEATLLAKLIFETTSRYLTKKRRNPFWWVEHGRNKIPPPNYFCLVFIKIICKFFKFNKTLYAFWGCSKNSSSSSSIGGIMLADIEPAGVLNLDTHTHIHTIASMVAR